MKLMKEWGPPNWLSELFILGILIVGFRVVSWLFTSVAMPDPSPVEKATPPPHRCIAEGWSDEGFQGDADYWVPEECIEYPCTGEDGRVYDAPEESLEVDCEPRRMPEDY